MYISEEDRKLIRKFDDIKNRGLYVQSSQLQAVYNRVFEVNLSATTCGSCLRGRTQKLVDALRKLELEEARQNTKEAQETQINEEKQEENKDATIKRTPKKKSAGKGGRKKGNKSSSV